MKDRNQTEEEAARHQGEGVLNQIKGNVKEAWGTLTNDPVTRREGRRDQVKGRLQEEVGDLKQRESELKENIDDLELRDRI